MTLSEFETYFLNFTTDIPELAQVLIGDEEELLNLQNSRVKYPLMGVGTPTPSFLYDPAATVFEFPFIFLKNVSKDSPEAQRAARNEMLIIAQKAWARLERGESEGLYEFIRNRDEGDAIMKYTGDNDTGWRFVARLKVGRDDC